MKLDLMYLDAKRNAPRQIRYVSKRVRKIQCKFDKNLLSYDAGELEAGTVSLTPRCSAGQSSTA
jgi:hypothetical protein